MTKQTAALMQLTSSIHSLRDTLTALREKRILTAQFCQSWRAQSALLANLPPRYQQVMEDLLGRLESGSLFTEESCSFSQEDLLINLNHWLDKAEQAISATSQ